MSSWIKLNQSFSKCESRNSRNKRILRDNVSTNIDDDSSSDNCDLISPSPKKKRKLNPLGNVTIEDHADSSDESCHVEYNPDGIQLPNAEKRKIMPTLPMVLSSSTVLSRTSPTNHSTSPTEFHSRKSWITIPKSNEVIDLSSKIEDSLTDSDEPLSTPDTVIDESSTDSSLMQSQITQQQETMIETQESITPPVAPFIVTTTKQSKKRKSRIVKGGMVEQLKKSLSQAKSNLSFWHHHRSAELIAPGTEVIVNRVENTYGQTLIHTKVNNEETIFSLCSKSLQVQEGDTIEVNFDIGRSYKTNTHVLYAYVDKVLPIKMKP